MWIGSPSTSKYIAEVVDAFNYLSGRLEFRFYLSDSAILIWNHIFRLNMKLLNGRESVERQVLAHGDIGIMPIPDSPFEREVWL